MNYFPCSSGYEWKPPLSAVNLKRSMCTARNRPIKFVWWRFVAPVEFRSRNGYISRGWTGASFWHLCAPSERQHSWVNNPYAYCVLRMCTVMRGTSQRSKGKKLGRGQSNPGNGKLRLCFYAGPGVLHAGWHLSKDGQCLKWATMFAKIA